MNNVIKGTVVERQSIKAKSAQQITSIANNLNKDLATIGRTTCEMLSARNQKIIDDASTTVRYMQQNGASQAAIDRVIRGACTQIAKNVGETVVDEFEKGVATLSQLGTYENPDDAALAFGRIAQPLTDASGKENMAAITKTKVLRFEDGKLVFNDAYKLGDIKEGMHNNVIIPVVDAAIQNLLGAKEYYIAHTHPYCNGHQNDQFSTGLGDQAVVDQLGAKGIYLVEPTTGEVYLYDKSVRIGTLNADIAAHTATSLGNTGIVNNFKYECINVLNYSDILATIDPTTNATIYYFGFDDVELPPITLTSSLY